MALSPVDRFSRGASDARGITNLPLGLATAEASHTASDAIEAFILGLVWQRQRKERRDRQKTLHEKKREEWC